MVWPRGEENTMKDGGLGAVRGREIWEEDLLSFGFKTSTSNLEGERGSLDSQDGESRGFAMLKCYIILCGFAYTFMRLC